MKEFGKCFERVYSYRLGNDRIIPSRVNKEISYRINYIYKEAYKK